MIDLMKRLAELDAQNPNIVQETDQPAEEGYGDRYRNPTTGTYTGPGSSAYADRHHGLDNEYQGAIVTWGKNKSKSFPSYDEAERFKNNLERKYPGLKAQVLGESDQKNLEECGMMDSMGAMSQPHTPASINMTAASGEELSGMLKDIMSLAGMSKDSEMPISTEPAAQTLEPAGPEMDATTSMRSVIDKMNPDDEEETDEAWDNEPNPETAGYDSMTPAGNDLHKQKAQYPAAQPGDNAMTMEQQLMAEYKKFINEDQDVTESTGMPYKHESYFADKMYTAVGGKDKVNVVDSPDGKYGYYKDLDGKTIGIFQKQDYTIHDGPGTGTIK